MGEILPFLSALKEVVVTAAAATGAFVALRFLRMVYKLRDAVALVRSPFMSSGEMSHAVKESDPSRPAEVSPLDVTKATAAAYEQRWKSILEAISDIEMVAQEAEALWGRSAVELLKPLRKSVGELRWALEVHLRGAKLKDDLGERVYDIVFAAKEDPFAEKLNEAITKVEDFIRPHLGSAKWKKKNRWCWPWSKNTTVLKM